MSKKHRVLQIDAWSDCCGCDDCGCCWSWNNWFHIDSVDAGLSDKEYSDYLLEQIKPEFRNKYEIEEDETNIVLVERKNRMPVLAIEIYTTIEEEY